MYASSHSSIKSEFNLTTSALAHACSAHQLRHSPAIRSRLDTHYGKSGEVWIAFQLRWASSSSLASSLIWMFNGATQVWAICLLTTFEVLSSNVSSGSFATDPIRSNIVPRQE